VTEFLYILQGAGGIGELGPVIVPKENGKHINEVRKPVRDFVHPYTIDKKPYIFLLTSPDKLAFSKCKLAQLD
jgi:hypothetical protein